MPYSPKNWHNSPETSTPISAEALGDLEQRLGAYADTAAEAIQAESPWKGVVATVGDLPITGNGNGDVRLVFEAPATLYTWSTASASWAPIAGGTTGGGGGTTPPGEAEMPVIATNLAGLGAGAYDGHPGIIRLGSYPDVHEEEFIWNQTAGKWVGTRPHTLVGQGDTWGMDLSDRPLEDIRQTYRRLRSALPYGKPYFGVLASNFVIGTNTSMTLINGTTFPSGGGEFYSRGRRFSYTGRTSNTLNGVALVSGTNFGTLPATHTILYSTSDVGGWGSHVEPLDHAGEMFAAGFTLEERIKIHLNGSQDDIAMTVGVYFFNYNSLENVPELSLVDTPTGGLGMGMQITGPPDSMTGQRDAERPFQIKTAGWSPWSASTPTKRWLIPMLFAKMESAAAQDNGEEYGCVYQVRWVST